MPSVPVDHRFEIVPDWVCEILSPATIKKDRVIKLPLYARHGVAFVWLIAAWKDDDPVAVPPFEAVTFSLADLWGG